MSKDNNNQNRNRNSRNNTKNRPFEDKLRPFITADIDKKINDLFSQTVRKIRSENSDFKKEVKDLIERIGKDVDGEGHAKLLVECKTLIKNINIASEYIFLKIFIPKWLGC